MLAASNIHYELSDRVRDLGAGDVELRRNDADSAESEVYLDALGAQRIPDPTTAGDFCRRFAVADVTARMEGINEARLGVWAQQPS